MNPIEIPGANSSLTKPKNWDEARDGECETLKVLTGVDEAGRQILASAWRPTKDELEALSHGHAVMLTIYGRSHPPVWIGVTPTAVDVPVENLKIEEMQKQYFHDTAKREIEIVVASLGLSWEVKTPADVVKLMILSWLRGRVWQETYSEPPTAEARNAGAT
jgi:hypothetical protein